MDSEQNVNPETETTEIIPISKSSKKPVKKIMDTSNKKVHFGESTPQLPQINPLKKVLNEEIKKYENNNSTEQESLPSVVNNKPTQSISHIIQGMPEIVKKSIKSREQVFTVLNFNEKVKYTDFYNLDEFKTYLEGAMSRRQTIEEIVFDGLEPITDLVLYIIYKYFAGNPAWSSLKAVSLQACRYVTDFGIELLSRAVSKDLQDVLDSSNLNGCVQVFNYLYKNVDSKNFLFNDIFCSETFNGCTLYESDTKIVNSWFKIVLINDCKLNMSEFLKYKKASHEAKPPVLNFTQILVQNKTSGNNYAFNIFEVDSKFPPIFNTQSSILFICLDYDNMDSFVNKLTQKLLQALNKGLVYLKTVILVNNQNQTIDQSGIFMKIKKNLKAISIEIDKEETAFFKFLNKRDFFDQECFRDKIRLKFTIEKFIDDYLNDHCKIIPLNDLSEAVYENIVNSISNQDLSTRYRNPHYTNLFLILKTKKYEKKIIKLEEFIDDCYSNEAYNFKIMIQADRNYKNLFQRFLEYENLLGEIILFKNMNNQIYFISDLIWFFDIVNRYIQTLTNQNHIGYISAKNLKLANTEVIRSKEFMDELKIVDAQQSELLLEILSKYFNLFSKIENEKENCLVIPDSNENNITDSLWPNLTPGCLQTSLILSLLFDIPRSVFSQIIAKFLKLPVLCYISQNSLICQEGCVNICIKYDSSKMQLELSMRSADINDILDEEASRNLKNFKKSFLFLFNEYKLVIESVLFENSIPFNFVKEDLDNLPNFLKYHTNIKEAINFTINTKPEDLVVNEHRFKVIDQFESRANFFRCRDCNISSEWNKQLYEAFRLMNPMLHSEKPWELKVTFSNVESEGVRPERLASSSIFSISDSAIFNGVNEMSLFNFDSFSCTLMNADADSIRIGVTIRSKETSIKNNDIVTNSRIVYVNCRTRWINSITNDISCNLVHKSETSKDDSEHDVVRTQRYTKKYKSTIPKLPMKFQQQSQVPVSQKSQRALLMEEIVNLRRDDGKVVRTDAQPKAESWIVSRGDCVKIKIVQNQDNNICEIGFYYNDEKLGFYLLEDFSAFLIYPYTEIKGGHTTLFFDMSSTIFTSIYGNEFSFKPGMYVELEQEVLLEKPKTEVIYHNELNQFNASKRVIWPASIKKIDDSGRMLVESIYNEVINEKTGQQLRPRLINWQEATSAKIHPCGYWNSLKTEDIEFKSYMGLSNFFRDGKFFDWVKFLKSVKSTGKTVAPRTIFNREQCGEMKDSDFVELSPAENRLSCDYPLNPRFIWSSLKQLTPDDISFVYESSGLIRTAAAAAAAERQNDSIESSAGIVLLPAKIDSAFVKYPNVNSLNMLTNLNIACLHREYIELLIRGGGNNYLSINFPHLIRCESLNLLDSKSKLNLKYVLLIMLTCLDLSNSISDPLFPNFEIENGEEKSSTSTNFDPKLFYQSLRSYFSQISFYLSLLIPFFNEISFRLKKTEPLKKLIAEYNWSFSNEESNKDSENELDGKKITNFVYEKSCEYGLTSGIRGECKYCSLLNVDLSQLGSLKHSLDHYLKKTLKTNQEYSKIITRIQIEDNELLLPPSSSSSNSTEQKQISFSKSLLKRLPNLSSITCKNVQIIEMDSSIGKCKSLRSMQLTNNGLTKLSEELFTPESSLTQIIVDNNPLTEVPSSLFSLESLRCIVFTRLSIEELPDGWFSDLTPEINVRTIHVAQTKLQRLPKDLILNNSSSLEQLTFQGVNLIIPEFEIQWPYMRVGLEEIIEEYCPNLMSVESATELFRRFDYDRNDFLDYKELQHFNAYIFKNFPRASDSDKNDDNTEEAELNTEFSGLPSKMFFTCYNLTYLDLSFQGFRRLPGKIRMLKNLKQLKLKYCVFLETLSAKLGMLQLEELDLTGCVSLRTPPLEIQKRGVNSVLAYLNRLLTGSVPCKRTKLMLSGLGGAGKTSLMIALMNKIYQNGSGTAPDVTDGISIRDWKVPINNDKGESDSLHFSVFDFAGQVVYYNTHQFFLTNRSVYLLVWNVRLGAEHSGLEFWLSSIECHAPACPIFVVGTHIDEVNKYELNIEVLKKRYPQIVGFHFVSSFNGLGIDELSKAIVETALNEKYMGEKIPECWLNFEFALELIKNEKSLLDYSECAKIASNHGIFDSSELSQALQFLHDLGSIMYFSNQEILRTKVVINPQFMVDLMACLVSVHNNFIVDGKLLHSDVGKIWKKYDPNLHEWILKVTERFDLTFAIPEHNINLVPCLMPDDKPLNDFDWNKLDQPEFKETKIVYNFEYLPIGLFNRAQVRLFQITENRCIWKNGSLLKKNNHYGLITRERNSIKIKCKGVQPENLVFLIHEVIELLITESFSGVDYDFSFPCPDCYDNKSIDSEASMFSASLVRRATQSRAVFLQCRNQFHVTPMADLHGRMPPDSVDAYDMQLYGSVRELKHLKQKFVYDVVILYSENESSALHPRQIRLDLEKSENLQCWFSERPNQTPVDSMSMYIRNARLVIVCLSNDFVTDQRCCELFAYTKQVLEPNHYLLVALGESLEWQKSQVGALVTHEFFVKINNLERYKTSLPDLIEVTRKKLLSTSKQIGSSVEGSASTVYQCFLSYCRTNSRDAVDKGTPLKSPDSLGWADPRSLKKHLEKVGYTVWIDFEQVGAKKTIFDDIVDGIRNASVFIACISNEYAVSENCMREFRFASNLKKPIVLCTFGSMHRPNEWKKTELGIISCLNIKEINFQLENKRAYDELLKEIRVTHKLAPILNKPSNFDNVIDRLTSISSAIDVGSNQNQAEKAEKMKTKETVASQSAYTELIELTQRKFLRQMAIFTDTATSRPFPRLFTLDLENSAGGSSTMDSSTMSSSSSTPATSDVKSSRFCLRALCECDSGWHPVGSTLIYELLGDIPDIHYAYLIRVLNLIKHSNLNLAILRSNRLDEVLNYIEDNLEDATTSSSASKSMTTPKNVMSVMRSRQPDSLFSFRESYNALKSHVISKLALEQQKNKTEADNPNKIEYFRLNRCSLPSGKIVWLCNEHSKEQYVQLLTSVENSAGGQVQNDEYSAILLEELRKYKN